MSRYFLSALLLFSLPHISWGQNSIDTFNVLTQTIRPKNDTSTFLYTDKVDTFFLNKIKRAVSKSKICGSEFIRYNTFKKRCLQLTKQERDYILAEMDEYAQSYWKENAFPNSKLISLETLYKIRDKTDKISLEKVKYKRPEFAVHQFTNPIWFGNGKYFLLQKITFWIRDKSFQISAIGDDLSVYRQDNGVWKQYFVVDGGIMDF